MSSIDKAVLLEALGWSRGGKASYKDKDSEDRDQSSHLPDEILKIIKEFTFFDVRTEAYREHLLKKNIKSDKLCVLNLMMYKINDGLRRYGTGEYGVEYNPINIKNNCCILCGEFSLWDPVPENIRCYCRFLTEEEIEKMEHDREDNYFLEEKDAEKDRERRRLNREFDNKFGDLDYDTDSLEDNPYSDRKPDWDGCSKYSLEDYDDY